MTMKVVFCAALVLASIAVSWSRSVNSISLSGFNVYNDGTKLHCDTLTCPATSVRCVISVKTDEKTNNANIETWKRCLNKEGGIDVEDKKVTLNPNPNEAHNIYLDSGSHGITTTLNYEEAKNISDAVIKEVEESLRELEKSLKIDFGF